MIRSPIPKHIGSSARIGVRERKIGKEKESKKEKHGEGPKKTSGTQKKKSRGAYGHGREKIT